MKNYVMIKSFRNGISVILDAEAPFHVVYTEMARKFRDSAQFFGAAKMVVSFEGRELSVEEERLLVNSISDNTELTVLCVMGKDEDRNQEYLKAASRFSQKGRDTDGQFYQGTIRAGQSLETDSSVIILGDVNPGADVYSTGNIVILGTLYGHAHAGCNGNDACFIVALEMKPAKIEIADYVIKDFSKNSIFRNKQLPKIAYIEDGEIRTEVITTALLNHLQTESNHV